MDVDMSASGDGDLSAFLGDFIDTMEDSGTDGIPVDNDTRQAQVSYLGAVDGALWHLSQHQSGGGGGVGTAGADEGGGFPPEFLHIVQELRTHLAASATLKVEVDQIKVLRQQHQASDIHSFTMLHLRFVEIMARHTRAFIAEVFGLHIESVAEQVSAFRRKARGASASAGGEDSVEENSLPPIAPLIGVSMFLSETADVSLGGDFASSSSSSDGGAAAAAVGGMTESGAPAGAMRFCGMLNFSPRRSPSLSSSECLPPLAYYLQYPQEHRSPENSKSALLLLFQRLSHYIIHFIGGGAEDPSQSRDVRINMAQWPRP